MYFYRSSIYSTSALSLSEVLESGNSFLKSLRSQRVGDLLRFLVKFRLSVKGWCCHPPVLCVSVHPCPATVNSKLRAGASEPRSLSWSCRDQRHTADLCQSSTSSGLLSQIQLKTIENLWRLHLLIHSMFILYMTEAPLKISEATLANLSLGKTAIGFSPSAPHQRRHCSSAQERGLCRLTVSAKDAKGCSSRLVEMGKETPINPQRLTKRTWCWYILIIWSRFVK